MNTRNIIIILVVIIVLGLGFYMFTKNNKEKLQPIEDVNSVQSIDNATKQDTTTAIEENIQDINLENSDSEFDSIDAEINKL